MSDDPDPDVAFDEMAIRFFENESFAESFREAKRQRRELGYVSRHHMRTMLQKMAAVQKVDAIPAETVAMFAELLDSFGVWNMRCVDDLANRAHIAIVRQGVVFDGDRWVVSELPLEKNSELEAVTAWAKAHKAVYGFDPLQIDSIRGRIADDA